MIYSKEISIIKVTYTKSSNWKKSFLNKLQEAEGNSIQIDLVNLYLTCKDIKFMAQSSQDMGKDIIIIRSTNPKTIVSANSLGYKVDLIKESQGPKNHPTRILKREKDDNQKPFFHHGTLHSGEHLESDGNLFLIGDVNPGAMVSAAGDVIIWGRLLGTAHAGKNGDLKAKISALQLRPVQLRIADKIARGPEEKPQPGFAEQAEIKSGAIVIFPAKTS